MSPSGLRALLVTVAADLLDEGGIEAVTLREVGRRAGVSHNAPYKHFRDKEDLLAAVAAAELTRLREGMAGARSRAAIRTLRAQARLYLAWARTHPQRFRLTFGTWSREDAALGAAAGAAREAMIGVVREAQAQGALEPGDPERLAYLVLSLAHGAAGLALGGHLSATGKGRSDPEDLVDALLDHLSTGARGR